MSVVDQSPYVRRRGILEFHVRQLAIGTLVHAVARASRITTQHLIGEERTSRLVRARFAAVWLARTTMKASWRTIGVALGDRDHTTIIHAYRRAVVLRDTDAEFRALTDDLLAQANDPAAAMQMKDS